MFCEDDPVGPAKALKAFAKDHPELEFKGGYLDGAVLDAAEALKLADLASREELLTRLAGLMHGALANTARLLNALPVKQAQLIQALIDAGGARRSRARAPRRTSRPPRSPLPQPRPSDEPAAEASDEDVPAADEATAAAPAGEDVVAEANEADAPRTPTPASPAPTRPTRTPTTDDES